MENLTLERLQIQAMEENVLEMSKISDNIIDEDGVATASQFSVQEWLLYRRRSLLNMKDKL